MGLEDSFWLDEDVPLLDWLCDLDAVDDRVCDAVSELVCDAVDDMERE